MGVTTNVVSPTLVSPTSDPSHRSIRPHRIISRSPEAQAECNIVGELHFVLCPCLPACYIQVDGNADDLRISARRQFPPSVLTAVATTDCFCSNCSFYPFSTLLPTGRRFCRVHVHLPKQQTHPSVSFIALSYQAIAKVLQFFLNICLNTKQSSV